MIIQSATFVTSSTKIEQCPNKQLPEFAFIGRSNVGKSSLINMLTNNHKLAKTSGTPGKTQTINHFLINNSWYLVDLPGYGFAKVSKQNRGEFAKIIQDYVLNRQELVCLFVLIDSRLEPQTIDLEFLKLLGKNSIPFSIIFTKTDKLKPGAIERNIETYKKTLLIEWEELPPIFQSSSSRKHGKEEILQFLENLL
ncbi:MAG TPA: ribosome biogenesis GTP-binding protein YihA/YsxC [Bacteroidales bacterium]|jgi:GTP-binding protein|nr:ribosome biogenesis GTP-binding protein YihA/YsxC [Bacteroidales bacterium]HRS18416.1 ribosome biogenesis GTP-binding protein YihA/YsxC [Bacteroidales bacterium]